MTRSKRIKNEHIGVIAETEHGRKNETEEIELVVETNTFSVERKNSDEIVEEMDKIKVEAN